MCVSVLHMIYTGTGIECIYPCTKHAGHKGCHFSEPDLAWPRLWPERA